MYQQSPYIAPLGDITLALDVAGLSELLALEAFGHVERDSVLAALEEFGKLASNVIAPSDRIGDIEGIRFYPSTGVVKTPDAFHKAYDEYVSGGWGALSFPADHGGGGLPSVVGLAIQEIFASANVALSLNPVLTQSAIEALLISGTDEQRSIYLPRLLTGEWTGTMNMTEPDAGSDLGGIRTQAELNGDGLWSVTGTKIFITWGDHDLASNVIHFVLARTPDAPNGTQGLSLFIVPKFVPAADASLGARNTLRCLRIEEKLGIHGSPTCVMEYAGAVGELVGPLHGGLRTMFTMMNTARLSIGIQGPAVAERAFQQAREYATNRFQGRAIGVTFEGRSPIIDHLDVRRMLLTMTTTTQASRMLLFFARAHNDLASAASGEEHRERSQQLVDLLTPIAKAWSTDMGFRAASLGVQVLGGVGYIEESGMAQRLRDARIASIYEGTNGIQALDLVARKISRGGGKWVRELLREAQDIIPSPIPAGDTLAESYVILGETLSTLKEATDWMLERIATARQDVVAGATSYLEIFGNALGGWLMIKRARLAVLSNHVEVERIVAESNFFAAEVVARSAGLGGPIRAGAGNLLAPIGAVI
jgi:alkylation response protein AidB-like acyl-CoA dehydrogenase